MTSWFHLARVPEPEVMDESMEVEAYASAAGEKHLRAIDQTFVEHVARHNRPAVFARATWTPHVDVYERDDTLVVVVEVAGVNPNEVTVTVEQGRLVIRGQRPAPFLDPPRICHAYEIASGPFERIVRLPFEVDAAAAQAAYTDGLLTITLPRRQTVPRRVTVEFGDRG